MKKLVLVVIDGMRPAAMNRAIASGAAPTLARLVRDGYSTGECISSFPSLTPVATSMITTGTGPDQHHVPSMHWYHRGDERYVDYGISFPAARKSGVIQVLKDLVHTINEEHLNRATPTFFERLESAGVRAACTTYMIYRGPHKHEFVGSGVAGALAGVTGMSKPGYGPTELIYGDIFDSQDTECRSSYGIPGKRDQHAACAAEALIHNEAYDFMVLSLPDNDNYSHRMGPEQQPVSISHADEQLLKVIEAYGGYRAFMNDHAVIVASDHSHSKVEEGVDLLGMLGEADWDIRTPRQPRRKSSDAQIAVSPAARFATAYVLDPSARDAAVPKLVGDLRTQDVIQHVIWREGDEAAVAVGENEIRFAPGTSYTDTRGRGWDVTGELGALDLRIADGRILSAKYPDALARAWSGLNCPGIGDVLVTPKLGYEFFDWGGVAHIGGGTHGSLHEQDSAAQLIVTGTGEDREDQESWSIADIYSLVCEHYGLEPHPVA